MSNARAKARMEREDYPRRRPGSVIPGGWQEKTEQAEACPDCKLRQLQVAVV